MANEKQISYKSYAAFWPFYLSQHAKPLTRYLHIGGTLLGLVAFVLALLTSSLAWFLIALFFGYGFAWLSHATIEKNHPATFTHPLWSFRGDIHMLFLWLSGRLGDELRRHQIRG